MIACSLGVSTILLADSAAADPVSVTAASSTTPSLAASSGPASAPAIKTAPDRAAGTKRSHESKGVVVVASGDQAADLTWPVALAVYGQAPLRPSIDDRTARILAGEAPPADADPRQSELAELRQRLRRAQGDDLTSRALLSDIARRTHAERLALVDIDGAGGVSVRIFEPEEGLIESTTFRADGEHGYRALLASLQARARPVPRATPPAPSTSGKTTPATSIKREEARPNLFSSPWFWAAVGGALVSAALIFVVTSTQKDEPPNAVVDWR